MVLRGKTIQAFNSPENKLLEALVDIIEGKNVKRVKHELQYEGRNISQLFTAQLNACGYQPTIVANVDVNLGERAPAFYIDNNVAYFGWVFWEQFTSWKLRKIWGSVVKNNRGDWEIQIPAGSRMSICANQSLKLEMDIDHPPEL